MKFTDRHNIRQYHFLPKYKPVVLFRDIHKKTNLPERQLTALHTPMEKHMQKH